MHLSHLGMVLSVWSWQKSSFGILISVIWKLKCVFFLLTPNKGSSKCKVSNLGWTLFDFSVERIQQLSAFNVHHAELHYFAHGS
jgi:hypothetical protein